MRPTSTFFSTESRFTRLCCWKIMATLRRSSRRSRPLEEKGGAVDDDLAAAVGAASRLMQRSSVDLPAPEGPSTTTNSPGRIDRLTFFSATCPA